MDSNYKMERFDRIRLGQTDNEVEVIFTTWSMKNHVAMLLDDIAKQWRTIRIGKEIIKRKNNRTFVFEKFFVPEIMYIVRQLIKSKRRLTIDRATYRDLLAALEENTWYAEVQRRMEHPVSRLDRSQLSMFIYPPTDFNKRFFDEYEYVTGVWGKNGHILAGAPGTGKTYMSLAIAEMRHADHIVVVCLNNNVQDPWVKSLSANDVYKVPQTWWYAGGNTNYNGERALIAHYEALDKLQVALPKLKGRVVVILDESHHMNEIKARRTRNFIEMCDYLRKHTEFEVIWASGTPLKKQGSEVVPFLLTTDPFFSEKIGDAYRKAFGAEGLRGTDIVNHRISMVMSVIEKTELENPRPVIEYVPIKLKNGNEYTLDNVRKLMAEFIDERFTYYKQNMKMYHQHYFDGIKYFKDQNYGRATPQAYNEYIQLAELLHRVAGNYGDYSEEIAATNAFEKDYIVPELPRDMAKAFINAKSVYKYLPLKIQGECLGRVVGGMRIQCIRDIAEHGDYIQYVKSSDSKTVIFSSYVSVVEKAVDKLKANDFKPLEFHGANTKELPKILRAFKEDPHANPIVTTFPSLSTGVPLVEASTMILLNPPFRPYVLEQSISRIDRIGQKHPTRVFILVLDTGTQDNISTRTKDILGWAQDMVEAIMGVKSAYGVNETQTGIESFIDIELKDSQRAINDDIVKVDRSHYKHTSLKW